MTNRRALVQGIIKPGEDVDPELAEEFIAGKPPRRKAKPAAPSIVESTPPTDELPPPPPSPAAMQPPAQPAQPAASSPLTGVGRVPVGARVRIDIATALKRASLNRHLQGIQPYTVQEILEDAIELWLHKHGLL